MGSDLKVYLDPGVLAQSFGNSLKSVFAMFAAVFRRPFLNGMSRFCLQKGDRNALPGHSMQRKDSVGKNRILYSNAGSFILISGGVYVRCIVCEGSGLFLLFAVFTGGGLPGAG